MGALVAPTSMALACRWRSRPQHQLRTSSAQQRAYLFDQLVGTTKQSDWKLTAERLGSLQIDDQLERRRLHDLVGPLADVHGFQCRSGRHYLRSAICRTHCSEIPSAFPIALSVAPDFRARAITLLRLTPRAISCRILAIAALCDSGQKTTICT